MWVCFFLFFGKRIVSFLLFYMFNLSRFEKTRYNFCSLCMAGEEGQLQLEIIWLAF